MSIADDTNIQAGNPCEKHALPMLHSSLVGRNGRTPGRARMCSAAGIGRSFVDLKELVTP
jgi:hypothetical protein